MAVLSAITRIPVLPRLRGRAAWAEMLAFHTESAAMRCWPMLSTSTEMILRRPKRRVLGDNALMESGPAIYRAGPSRDADTAPKERQLGFFGGFTVGALRKHVASGAAQRIGRISLVRAKPRLARCWRDPRSRIRNTTPTPCPWHHNITASSARSARPKALQV